MVFVHIDRFFTHGEKDTGQQGFYLDDNLYFNIKNYLIPAVKNSWDGIFCVSGVEGSGKSSLAQTIGFFVDPSLCIDRIVFTPQELLRRIDESKEEQCIIFDEAVMGMMSQDASTALQNVLIKKFVTIRKKRLYIIIVIPSIFMLRKYFAIFRTRFLLHTFTPDGISRGLFKFYGYNTKRLLYIRGGKEFDQGFVKEDFVGKFVNIEGYFVDPKEYDFKKEAAIASITAEMGEKKMLTPKHKQMIIERDLMIMLFYKYYKFNEKMSLKLRGKPEPEDIDKKIDVSYLKLLADRIRVKMTKPTLDKSFDRALMYLDMEEKKEFDKKKRLQKMEIDVGEI
jgi:hypothetical protein